MKSITGYIFGSRYFKSNKKTFYRNKELQIHPIFTETSCRISSIVSGITTSELQFNLEENLITCTGMFLNNVFPSTEFHEVRGCLAVPLLVTWYTKSAFIVYPSHDNYDSIFPKASEFPPGKDIGLYTFEFNDIPLDELETVKCTITMFTEANLLAEFKIPLEVNCPFMLS